jgi:hypothetical protein
MTLYAWGRPRRFPNLPPAVPRWFDVAPDARVLAHVFWQPDASRRPTVLCLHGLEGSSQAHYMRALASKAWARGWNAVLLNQRNCGGTEHLSAGLYHSGLTADPRRVIDELIALDGVRALAVVGYSLGGNLTVRLAGEYGATPPAALRACVAVSPTIDLACCVDALERPSNRVYQWHFVRSLKARLRRKGRLFPDRFDLGRLPGIRTVREFDEAYTAPNHGFAGAADYYYRASAVRVADRIAVPTAIVTAADDPFVPPEQFSAPGVARNPNVGVVLTAEGGHCGFVSEALGGSDGYWAEDEALAFVENSLAASA